jgi:antibiotic biosynthesis monooxygenase (ABM) superfamily enzyme
MHAVVVRTTIHDAEAAHRFLKEEGIQLVSQAPGFVSAHRVRFADTGTGTAMFAFETREAAHWMADALRSNPPPTDLVTLSSIEVGEIIERA